MAKLTYYTSFQDLKTDKVHKSQTQSDSAKESELKEFLTLLSLTIVIPRATWYPIRLLSSQAMEGSIADSILHVCKVLNKYSVEYLLIGGTAVALHGYYRPSRQTSGEVTEKHDLDFWYNSNYNNYFRLLDALEELGQDISRLKAEKSPNPKKSFFRLEYDKFTVDFLPELPGLSKFRQSYSKCEVSKIGEIEIPFISYADLIINKQTQGRAKDIEDIEQLKLRRTDTE